MKPGTLEDTLGKRLTIVRRLHANLDQVEFSKVMDVGVATISRYENDDRSPDADFLMRLIEKWPVDPSWLLTGIVPATNTNPTFRDEFAYINNLKVEAAAGDGSAADSEVVNNRMAFRKDWLQQHGLQPEKLCFITARGDSMEPLIRSGDTLLVNVYFHNDGARLVHGLGPGKRAGQEGIFVLRLDGGLVIKRLQPDLDGGYKIKSDNHEYSELYKKAEELTIVGKVEWIGRRL